MRRKLDEPGSLLKWGRLARKADSVLTYFLALCFLLFFLYTCYALYDSWRIYDGARLDASLLEYKPTLDGDRDSFSKLLELNPDVCAWLTIEDTPMDYPVVQGKDNMEYLNTDVYGEFSLSGSLFLDSRNERDFADLYSMIYGHHMEGDVMFGPLSHFMQKAYFDEHPVGTLFCLDETFEIEFFASLKTDAYDPLLFSAGNLGVDDQALVLSRIKDLAIQYREIGVDDTDRLLALSTCSDTSTNARTIVVGRLNRVGGEEAK